jgi:hypothetical protein
LPDETVRRVLDLSEPPREATHWTGQMMAQNSAVSLRSVQRIWAAHGLEPHHIRTIKLSRDPQLSERLKDVVGLYVDPPAHAFVLSLDEQGGRTPKNLDLADNLNYPAGSRVYQHSLLIHNCVAVRGLHANVSRDRVKFGLTRHSLTHHNRLLDAHRRCRLGYNVLLDLGSLGRSQSAPGDRPDDPSDNSSDGTAHDGTGNGPSRHTCASADVLVRCLSLRCWRESNNCDCGSRRNEKTHRFSRLLFA